jgi:hypothetical protein
MTIWMYTGFAPFAASWATAWSRWSARPIEPVVALPLPVIALIRSSHTPVGWLATRLPPGSAVASARHCGLLYPVAPAYGLSTRPLPPDPCRVAVTVADR